MSGEDFSIFVENNELQDVGLPPMSPEERAARIAAVLRGGHPSPGFCRMLALMLDGKEHYTPFILTLRRRGRGQPAKANSELGKATIAAVDGAPHGHQKRRIAEVAKKFGVTPRAAEKAMSDQLRQEKMRRLLEGVGGPSLSAWSKIELAVLPVDEILDRSDGPED